MKDDKKRERLAALFGLEEHLPTEPTPPPTQVEETNSREAEAVLEYISRPQLFKQVECKQCGYVFATNRGNVAYCSDTCRKHKLAEIGITWNPEKPPELRWDYREPLIVPPPALVVANLASEMAKSEEVSEATGTYGDSVVLPESEIQQAPIVYNL